MRKSFTLTILSILLSSSFLFAQSKVTRYCMVLTSIHNLKEDIVKINLKLGDKDSNFLLKDSSLIIQLLKVNDLKSTVDLLNYMSNQGWELINIIPQNGAAYLARDYYFKKEFDKSDFQ